MLGKFKQDFSGSKPLAARQNIARIKNRLLFLRCKRPIPNGEKNLF